MTLWVRVQILWYTGILEVIGSVGPYQHDGGRCRLQRKTLRSCYIWEVCRSHICKCFTFRCFFWLFVFFLVFVTSWRRFCLNFGTLQADWCFLKLRATKVTPQLYCEIKTCFRKSAFFFVKHLPARQMVSLKGSRWGGAGGRHHKENCCLFEMSL